MITYINKNNEKKELSLKQIEGVLSNINDGSFIFYDMFEKFITEGQIQSNQKEAYEILMFILKFNEKIYEELTKNNKELSFRNFKFDDELLEFRQTAFIGTLTREKQINNFCEQIKQGKYYQLDDNFGKTVLSLLINMEDELVDTDKFFHYINDAYKVFHEFPFSFFVEYYSILDEIIQNNMDKDIWDELFSGKKINYQKQDLYEKFMNLNNNIKQRVSSKAGKDLYAFYMSYSEKHIWLNIARLVELQKLYQLKSKKILFKLEKFEKNINKFYPSNIDNIIDDIITLSKHDMKVKPNLKKADRWLNNLNRYIRTKDIEKFTQCFDTDSKEMSSILAICLIQDDKYNKLALEEYELQEANKNIEIIKEDSNIIVIPTKETLINNIGFSKKVKDIILQENFSFEKVEFIVDNINNKVFTIDFVERNILNLIDKNMYKRLKQNIKLFNTITKFIILYNSDILFADNELLKRRVKIYTEDYKLSMNNIDNYEFLLSDDVFGIIDGFIKLGYYKTIQLYPKYLSVNSINILKRLQIASTDSSIITLNDDLSFTDDIITGNGFPIEDNELDQYLSDTSINSIENKVKLKVKN